MDSAETVKTVLREVLFKLSVEPQSLHDLINGISADVPGFFRGSLAGAIIEALHEAGIVEKDDNNWCLVGQQGRRKVVIIPSGARSDLITAATIVGEEFDRLRASGAIDEARLGEATKLLDSAEAQVTLSEDCLIISRLVGLERAKCAALERNWRAAVRFIRDSQALQKSPGVDKAAIQAEADNVWSYIQEACLGPIIRSARPEAQSTVDILLTVNLVCKEAGLPLTDMRLFAEMMHVAIRESYKTREPRLAEVIDPPEKASWHIHPHERVPDFRSPLETLSLRGAGASR